MNKSSIKCNNSIFKSKVLLISGGTGSFGNAVLRRFLETDIKEIRIFSRDELKQDDMRRLYNSDKIKFYIGDVRDRNSIDDAMRGVDYVFHAAALKQVPSCEFYPMQAVKTNVIGTENLLNSAIDAGVKKVIALSTDKAVYPINAMGISKALMEKVAIATARHLGNSKTKITITRYGNVMASRGSVIPLFIKQIKENKPLSITDPNMTRFIMSLENAVDLVLYAFKNCNQGDIFVQKSPAATIENLAIALKEIFKAKNKINIIGTRHGEKKHEILLGREELFKSIDLGEYYKVPIDNRNLNYEKYFELGDKPLSSENEYSSKNTNILDKDELIKVLLNLEYLKFFLKD